MKKRGRELEQRIAQERQDMELSVQQLQMDFRKHFQGAFLGMEQKTLSHFARLETQQVAGEEKKCAFLIQVKSSLFMRMY